jgi:hypothetical protein
MLIFSSRNIRCYYNQLQPILVVKSCIGIEGVSTTTREGYTHVDGPRINYFYFRFFDSGIRWLIILFLNSNFGDMVFV